MASTNQADEDGTPAPAGGAGTFRLIATNRHIRRIYFAVSVSGVALSIYSVLIPVHVASMQGGSAASAGLYSTIVSAVAIPVTLLIGRASDRMARRNILLLTLSLWVSVGFVLAAVSQTVVVILLVGALFFSVTDSANAQLLTRAREVAEGLTRSGVGLLANLRAGYSLGYVLGPVVLSGLLLVVDKRLALASLAGFYIAACLLGMAPGPPKGTHSPKGPKGRPSRGDLRIWLCAVSLALALSATAARATYLALFATLELGIGLKSIALAFTIAPMLEVFLMPLCGAVAARIGPRPVLVAGACSASLSLALLAVSTSWWHLACIQVLDAVIISSLVGVGVGAMQDLAAGRHGFGTSLFFAGRTAGHFIGAGACGLLVTAYGFRPAFAVTAVWIAVGGVGLLVFGRSTGHHGSS